MDNVANMYTLVQILNGTLTPGEVLPSIRNLAKELKVSIITSKRAYEELEKEGFVETVTGKGTFVAKQNTERLKETVLYEIENKLEEIIKQAKASRHPMINKVTRIKRYGVPKNRTFLLF